MYETTINVEVTGHSQYGKGVEQGVKFANVPGYWTLSFDLRETTPDEKWPPPEGTVFRAKLRAKPKAKVPGKFYQDIIEYGKATGPAESWSYDGASAPSGGGPRAASSGSDAAAAFGGGNGGNGVDARNRSIERQVVLKCMAEVLAASVHVIAAGSELVGLSRLAADFESRCDELWNGDSPTDAARDAADLAAGPDDHGDAGEYGQPPPGVVDPDDVPF